MIATNLAGLTGVSKVARIFIDTVALVLKVTAAGRRRVGSEEVARLTYSDPAPASGVAKLTIRWGDGTVAQIKPGTHRVVHVYRRPGRYKITVTVADRAGNQTTVVRRVKINPARTGHK